MVEWKRLGDVCEVLRGKRLTKSQLNDENGYPVLHGGSTPMGYYEEFNRKANTTVVVNTGNAGSVFFYDKEFWSSDACFSLYPNKEIIDKYLYLYIYGCERILKGKIRAGAMPTIDAKAVEELIIPIPSLSEQTRIVGILDTFTASIDNLKEQIAERRKQYEYYRDQLLDHISRKWSSVILKDVAVIKNGKDYKNLLDGNVPVYGTGGIMTYVNQFFSNQPSVLLPRKGSVDNIFYVEEPFWTVDTLYWTEINVDKVIPKYLYLSLRRYNLKDYAYGGARPSLSQPILYKLEIPLPPLSEQSRIVSILDTFEASIVNLEAQLELREKQYEYYRNKLLTFERKILTCKS